MRWRDIKTAPRDGTIILGWFGRPGRNPYAESIYWSAGLWVWSHDGDSPSEGNEPTHWMPLPWMPLPDPPDNEGETE